MVQSNTTRIASPTNMCELQWQDVRAEFALHNAELAQLIDDIDPGPKYTLFKASYPFGKVAEIVNLSPRTVMFYTHNMGIKLKCRKKSELLDKIRSSDVLKQLEQLP